TTPVAAPELDRFTHDRIPKGARVVGLPREVVAVLGSDANHPIFGKPRQKEVRALTFNREGTLLVSGGEDEVIHVWNLASGKERYQLLGHNKAITGLALAPDEKTLASTSLDGTARIWLLDKEKGMELESLPAGPGFAVAGTRERPLFAYTVVNGVSLWE